MLHFRTMRAVGYTLILSVLLLLGSLLLPAQNHHPQDHQPQKPKLHFHPGSWEINSVTTTPTGRTVSSQTTLCANEQIDFWKVAQANLVCKTPKTHSTSANTLHVSVHCEYNGEKLHSDIRSDAVETFSDQGNGFTLEGTTTTDTTYQGVQPSQTSIQLQATAHRTGPCQ